MNEQAGIRAADISLTAVQYVLFERVSWGSREEKQTYQDILKGSVDYIGLKMTASDGLHVFTFFWTD